MLDEREHENLKRCFYFCNRVEYIDDRLSNLKVCIINYAYSKPRRIRVLTPSIPNRSVTVRNFTLARDLSHHRNSHRCLQPFSGADLYG